MIAEAADFFPQEQTRITAVVQDLFMERGISAVALPEIALALRLPVSELARYFPGGKPALVTAVTNRWLTSSRQELEQHALQSSNAVEEMLRVRRTLQALPTEMRSPLMRELEADYPTQYQHLHTERLANILDYIRQNLQRGIRESLYQPQLNPEEEAQRWFKQSDAVVSTASTSQALSDLLTTQVMNFLTRVTTPAGAYVMRRLQEVAPFY